MVSGKKHRRLQAEYDAFRKESDRRIGQLALELTNFEESIDQLQAQLAKLPVRGKDGKFQSRS